MKTAYGRLFFLGATVLVFILLAFYAADYVANNSTAQHIVEQFGLLGIVFIGFIAGLNIAVPIHAATFTPIFSAAGFTLPVIIFTLAVGTTLADLVSYALGRFGRRMSGKNMAEIREKVEAFTRERKSLILPGIFLYAAFVPFPNEAILIPLGLMGFRLKVILIPLILGTILNQTIFALGFTSVFNALF